MIRWLRRLFGWADGAGPSPSERDLVRRWHQACRERVLIPADERYRREVARVGLEPRQSCRTLIDRDEFHELLAADLLGPGMRSPCERDLALARLWQADPRRVEAATRRTLAVVLQGWYYDSLGSFRPEE